MRDLASAPAARQTVTMRTRLAAAGLIHGAADPAPPPPAAGAGEYAPGTAATITVRYTPDRTVLTVENHARPPRQGTETAAEHGPDVLAGAGGGHGLAAMRERAQRAGGTARAGPAADGWLVELEIPA